VAIANSGNRRLEVDFDGLSRAGATNLDLLLADVRDAASTERLFDRRLVAIEFPPNIESVAHALYAANESRANLTERATTAQSVEQLRHYLLEMTAANAPVEYQVRRIRRDLGLPPPSTS
jgi:hypothetical protein